MKKYFASFIETSTVASLVSACGKKADAKTTTANKKEGKKTEANEASPKTLKKELLRKGNLK